MNVRGRVDLPKEKAEIDKILEAETAGLTLNNTIRVEKK